jgi:hypothetical protein
MIWTVGEFQTEYSKADLSSGILTPVLTDAENVVEAYLTDAAYADAIDATPTDAVAFLLIRRAIGDITLLYLRQRNQIAPVTQSYSKSYGGVKSYSVSGGQSAAAVADSLTESKILSRLSAYARALPSLAQDTWGTGRFIGLVSEEEIEEEEEGF